MNKKQSNHKKYSSQGSFDYQFDKSEQERIAAILAMIDKILKDSQKTKLSILDLACGNGKIAAQIKELAPDRINIYGIDTVSEALNEAAQNCLNTKLGDLESKFPYQTSSFDLVFAGEIIEHIFDTKHFLSEIYRILKKDGVLLLSTPNLANLQDRLRFLFGINPTHVTPIHEYLHLHIRPFTKYSLVNTLNHNGFKVEKLTSNVFDLNIFSTKHSLFSKKLAEILPGLSWNLIVMASKC